VGALGGQTRPAVACEGVFVSWLGGAAEEEEDTRHVLLLLACIAMSSLWEWVGGVRRGGIRKPKRNKINE